MAMLLERRRYSMLGPMISVPPRVNLWVRSLMRIKCICLLSFAPTRYREVVLTSL